MLLICTADISQFQSWEAGLKPLFSLLKDKLQHSQKRRKCWSTTYLSGCLLAFVAQGLHKGEAPFASLCPYLPPCSPFKRISQDAMALTSWCHWKRSVKQKPWPLDIEGPGLESPLLLLWKLFNLELVLSLGFLIYKMGILAVSLRN